MLRLPIRLGCMDFASSPPLRVGGIWKSRPDQVAKSDPHPPPPPAREGCAPPSLFPTDIEFEIGTSIRNFLNAFKVFGEIIPDFRKDANRGGLYWIDIAISYSAIADAEGVARRGGVWENSAELVQNDLTLGADWRLILSW